MPTLVVQDALHAHAADNVALTQANVLVVQSAAHGHTADQVLLTFDVDGEVVVDGVAFGGQVACVISHEDLDTQERTTLGPMRSAVRGGTVRPRVFSLQWDDLTAAQVTSLLDNRLLQPGDNVLQGDLIGETVLVVVVGEPEVREGLVADTLSVSVQLREVGG